jgi:cell division transport system permease protein
LSAQEDKYTDRRVSTSYFTTTISISLVLFMLGLLGLIVLNAKKLSNYVKENIGFSVILKDDVKEVEITQLKKMLDAADYVKSAEYITKEDAAATLQKELGEDFISFLGYNPLLSSIEVSLKAEYTNTDSIAWIEKDLMSNPKIKEVFYQKSLVSLVNENVRKISLILVLFSGVMMLIAIVLINNSIRLSIYSKRFLIKSMQLVGATQSFIRRPFVIKGVIHGIYGAFISILLLMLVLYWTQKEIPELFEMQDAETFALLFGLVILMGIIISWISTYLAVRKFLRLKADDLYY